MDHINQCAYVGIIIGDKSYWNKGYGTDALKTLVSFGFNYLNLHNISLMVYSFNKKAIHCYEKVGFKIVGNRRESFVQNKVRYDEVIMVIIPSDLKN
ncbi:MAG: GNAT family N-acetyltransferase [Exilispira sp.]|nr:GNAT family N-acetyltransferase [Exilispira sp.]